MTREQKTNETREQYLKKARDYCRRRFNAIEAENCHHPSHSAAQAMEETEKRFTDLGTFGVEGDCEENGEGCITIQYLNSGDSYDSTIIYWEGRFIVSSWGDIVENVAR